MAVTLLSLCPLWRAVPCHGHRGGALLRFGQHSESSAHRNINVGVSWAPPAPGLAGVKVPAPHRSCWWHPGQAFLPKTLQELGLAASPGPGRDAQTGLVLLGQPHHFWALGLQLLEVQLLGMKLLGLQLLEVQLLRVQLLEVQLLGCSSWRCKSWVCSS